MFTILLALTLPAQASPNLPLATDQLLRTAGDTKLVMLLDESGSMRQSTNPPISCSEPLLSYQVDRRFEQVQAALIGCSPGSGVFDRMAENLEIAILGYGGPNNNPRIRTLQTFTDDGALLETAVAGPHRTNTAQYEDLTLPGIVASGGTPTPSAIKEGLALLQNEFDHSTTEQCTRLGLVLLSDGQPTGPSVSFTGRCDGTAAASSNPADGSLYGASGDMLCRVAGEQPISTYTIGFGPGATPGNPAYPAMDNTAAGDGFFRPASNVNALASAFESILLEVATPVVLSNGAAAVSSNGVFAGNRAYLSQFKPQGAGLWSGNIKKACIFPPKLANNTYDTSEERCLLKAVGSGQTLVVNDSPEDLFVPGAPVNESDIGGVGHRVLQEHFAGKVPGEFLGSGLANAAGNSRRNIKTWTVASRAGALQWKSLGLLTPADVGLAPSCDFYRTRATILGQDPDLSFSCDLASSQVGVAQFVGRWPVGAIVNGGATLIQYDSDCETPGNCLLAAPTNAGVLDFFDPANGNPIAGFVPGDLWNGSLLNSRTLLDMSRKPNADYRRLPLLDGQASLYHLDTDRDGLVDSSEQAWLVFGLGHGGDAIYMVDVSNKNDLENWKSIPRTQGNWTENLRAVREALTFAFVRTPTNDFTPAMVFASGSVWEAEARKHPLGSYSGGYSVPPGTERRVDCRTVMGQNNFYCLSTTSPFGWLAANYEAAFNPLLRPTGSLFGNPGPISASPPASQPINGSVGGGSSPTPTLPTLTPAPPPPPPPPVPLVRSDLVFLRPQDVNAGSPNLRLEQITGIEFQEIDIEVNDTWRIKDSNGDVLLELTDADNSAFPVTKRFSTRLKTVSGELAFSIEADVDGQVHGNGSRGLEIKNVLYTANEPLGAGHKPFVAILQAPVDIGTSVGGLLGAADQYRPGSEIALFTSDCTGSGVGGPFSSGVCIDENDSPDLKYLKCPISARVEPFSVGRVAERFYVGDTCGQVWRFHQDQTTLAWKAARILNVNEDLDVSQGLANINTEHVRRFEESLDIFSPRDCGNANRVGIGFGTGSNALAQHRDALISAAATPTLQHPGRDVVGVFFDDLTQPRTQTLGSSGCKDCIEDLTAAGGAQGTQGWYFALQPGEKALFDPVTVEMESLFKTFEPDVVSGSCSSQSGRERLYAVQTCSGESRDPDASRRTLSNMSTFVGRRIAQDKNVDSVGGELVVFAPADRGQVVVDISGPSRDANGRDLSASVVDEPIGRFGQWKLGRKAIHDL